MDDTHECFLFYDYIVDAIMLRCDGVDYIFLDFGCKFGRHYGKRDCPDAAARARLKIVLPAMHAEGHVKPCRLRNCGIYIDGLGYVMGEEMEQLWYLSKFWAASTRSMTRAHRIDFLNLALDWVAKRKASNMYKSLTKKVSRLMSWTGNGHSIEGPLQLRALVALIIPSPSNLSLYPGQGHAGEGDIVHIDVAGPGGRPARQEQGGRPGWRSRVAHRALRAADRARARRRARWHRSSAHRFLVQIRPQHREGDPHA